MLCYGLSCVEKESESNLFGEVAESIFSESAVECVGQDEGVETFTMSSSASSTSSHFSSSSSTERENPWEKLKVTQKRRYTKSKKMSPTSCVVRYRPGSQEELTTSDEKTSSGQTLRSNNEPSYEGVERFKMEHQLSEVRRAHVSSTVPAISRF